MNQFSSVAWWCLTLWDPMDSSMPGFRIHHQLLDPAKTHIHWIGDAIQTSHPLLCPSPPAFSLSQHQGLFKWGWLFTSGGQSIGASASASVLPLNIQGWFPRIDWFDLLQFTEVAQPCQILWDPMDCSLPGSSIHGIFKARVLEWSAISFSRGSSQPRDRTQISGIAGGFFTVWAPREAQEYWRG